MNKVIAAIAKGAAIIGLLGLCYVSLKYHISPKWGINIESSSWMPAGSSNGAFAQGGNFFILGPPSYYREFDISETDFIRYMETEGWEYEEIVKPQTHTRYLIMFVNNAERNRRNESLYTVRVTHGLFHTNYEGDSGRRIVYDRERGRAFYRYDTR